MDTREKEGSTAGSKGQRPGINQANVWSSHCGAMETNPTRNHEAAGSKPGLTQQVKDLALP